MFQLLEQRAGDFAKFTYDFQTVKTLLDGGHLYLRHVLRSVVAQLIPARRPEGGLRRDWHDEMGDVVRHRDLPARPFIPERPGYYEVDAKAIQRLADLAELCRQRGARLMIFHPAVARADDSVDSEAYQPIYDALERSTDIAQLNQPMEMMYERNLFFDSSYHLNAEGIEKRTAMLIERLKDAIN
jgi:hypothetical protein